MPEIVELATIVAGGNCVSSDDGHVVYGRISRNLAKGRDVIVSFEGVEDVTTAFLNAAFGKLYGAYADELIRKHLIVEHAQPHHLTLLKRVVDRAKDFFSDREGYESALRAAIGD